MRGLSLCCCRRIATHTPPWCPLIGIICIANQHRCTWKDCYRRFVCLTNPGEPSSCGGGGFLPQTDLRASCFQSGDLWPPELFGKAAVSGVSVGNSHFMLKMFESQTSPSTRRLKGAITRLDTIALRIPLPCANGLSSRLQGLVLKQTTLWRN